MSASIRLNTSEFSRALRDYMPHTKRDLAEVINQKSYSINMAANAFTHKATKAEIRAELEAEVTAANGRTAPRAALIINAIRKANGEKGLYGAEMMAAMAAFIKRRASHVAFLRSGWLPAMAKFARAIGKTPGRNAMRWEAANIGGGNVARPGWKAVATFWNQAAAQDTRNVSGASRMAAEGLSAAIQQEIGRMAQHVAQKLQKTADKFNA